MRRLATAAVLAAALAAPTAAWAAEEVTVTYGSGQAVAEQIQVGERTYALKDWKAEGGGEAPRGFERTQEATVAAADYSGDPKAHFPAAMEIDEDGYKGEIPLADAKAEPGKSHENRTDYEKVDKFTDLTQKELDALPDKVKVTVEGRELTLEKLDVDAERVPSDPGTPLYDGTVTYGIHEGETVVEEYKLTATYRGEIDPGTVNGTVTATYEATAAAAAADASESAAELAQQAAAEQQKAREAAGRAQQLQQQQAAAAEAPAAQDGAWPWPGIGIAVLVAALALAAWAGLRHLLVGSARSVVEVEPIVEPNDDVQGDDEGGEAEGAGEDAPAGPDGARTRRLKPLRATATRKAREKAWDSWKRPDFGDAVTSDDAMSGPESASEGSKPENRPETRE